MRCRTKTGELRLYYEGKDYLLDSAGLELPEDLARDIHTHVNVIVGDSQPNGEETDGKAKATPASTKRRSGTKAGPTPAEEDDP